jgi:murein DD-endopeptidase MepM/ murein hydrolase activator NlpD
MSIHVRLVSLIVAVVLPGTVLADEVLVEGDFVQGGRVIGAAPPGSRVAIDGRALRLDRDGRFMFGFGRDAAPHAELRVHHPDGRLERRTLEVERRSFRVQRIDGLPPAKVTPRSAEELAQIRKDNRAIGRARALDSPLPDVFGPMSWPATGRITGVFGSQRVLNGQPRSPHKGVDIAAGRGTAVGAMAGGRVSLVAPDMYFTGTTVMIDHGHGLHSIYAHLESAAVAAGEEVAAGQTIGRVGSSGRATGPHLHWGVYWFDEALDPELLVGPMPAAATKPRES